MVLDFKLKKQIFSISTKRRHPTRITLPGEIAEQHALKVVSGRIVFPDLRIEIRDARSGYGEGRSGGLFKVGSLGRRPGQFGETTETPNFCLTIFVSVFYEQRNFA